MRILFLNPFRDSSAISIGNSNIIRSIDLKFEIYLFKTKEHKLDTGYKRPTIYKVSNNPILRAIQSFIGSILLSLNMDVMIGNGGIREALIYPVAKLFNRKLKYVFFLHTCYERLGQHKNTLRYKSFRYLMKKADKIISISDFAKRGFVKAFNLDEKKITTIINSVDTDFFDPSKRDVEWFKKRYGIENDQKNILYLGKINKTKGADLIPWIAKELQGYNFILQGSNDLGLDLSKQDNIYFSHERPPREDIPKIFASSDAFLFPSEVEPCGAVVTEALASGLPVIASEGGATPEQVIKGTGFLIPIGAREIENFAISLRTLFHAHTLYSKNARERALEFDRVKVGKKYDAVLESFKLWKGGPIKNEV